MTTVVLTSINVRLELKGIVSEWDDLGEVLGLPHDEIKSIEVNYPKDVKKCLKEVIRKWLEEKGSGPPSWKSLCEALRHPPLIEREDVASKIEKKYVIDYLHKEREGGEYEREGV